MMMVRSSILLVLTGVIVAHGQRPVINEVCFPKVPTCPGGAANTEACPTCCCNSSGNVEFYDPAADTEPECTAPPAVYEITFIYTWSNACHPDNYSDNANWSRPFAISHNSDYKLWDACMDDVSDGVALFSQTGNLDGVTAEGVTAALTGNVIDAPIFDGDSITGGTGETSIYLTLDKYHPYVSTLTRLEPSPDQVVGVADLRLCDGDKWRESVKVCFELFSTATASERVAGEMMRNSVQENSCSFGYVEFNLIKTQTFEPRTMLNADCYPKIPEKCPRSDPIEECPTCCCESGDNVEFYDPGAEEPNCTALPATYEMKFNFAWSEVCHPGDYLSYSIFNPVWSAPIGVSHNIKYRLWDACMDDVSVGVGLVSQIGLTGVLVQEFTMAGSNILDYTVDSMFVQPSGQSSQNLRVDKDHQWVSAISNRGPTPDQLVGVADLHLCDGDKWRESVKVCFELFSTAAASERVAGEMERNSVQGDSCSFGYVEFDLIEDDPGDSSALFGAVLSLAGTALCALVAVLG